MSTQITNQVTSHFARLLVLVLAALALSSAHAPAVHASPLPLRAPAALLQFSAHGQVLGLPLAELSASVDPVINWHTFLGGNGADYANAAAVDAAGNIYIAGNSYVTWGSPVRDFAAELDVFVAKLSPGGALLWHTFLGGSGEDYGKAVAVDASGNAYIAGYSNVGWASPIRPYTSDYDGFVAKLSPTGVLLWNTFLGDSGTDWADGVAVDGDGNVYVAGTSGAAWQGTTPPVRSYTSSNDAFAAKLDPNGVLTWNTFLGGSGIDNGLAVVVDGNANAYIAGESLGSWLPLGGAPVPIYHFVAKLSPIGALTSTFGNGGKALAIDGNGYFYAAGDFFNYPYSLDAYANKLNPSGALLWGTVFGSGWGADYGSAIAVGGDGNVYVTGNSSVTWGAPVHPFTGAVDGYVLKMNSGGQLLWNSFLGGTGDDFASAVALDGNGNVYVAGHSGASWGSPVRPFAGGGDAFVARLNAVSRVYLPLTGR